MVRVWLLQANPERYDIDGALGALDRINWRVPQHTAEIDVDDIAVLWRSGRKAGIVGLGRMLSAPAADICFPEEKPFLRQPEPGKATGSESETDRVTRAPVGVRRTGFVPKQEVASSVLARHHFLRAPMGTVFPLNTAEWSTVRMLVAADPPQEQGWDHEQGALPRPFAWQERSGRVHQIPGGVAGYEATLRKVLAHVRDASPGQPALHGFLIREFAIAASYAEHMTQFLGKASLLRWSESTAALTHHAEHWLATGDRDYLVALLHSRVRFVGELLGELRQPTNAMALRRAAHQHYGMHWTTAAQIDRRRYWLEATSMVTTTPRGLIALTEAGRSLLDRLELEPPHPPVPQAAPPAALPAALAQARPLGSSLVSKPQAHGTVEQLTADLREASKDSANPSRFEQLIKDAFAFLGYEAAWIGGSGNPDVVLDARLAKGEQYRAVVEAKTTSHEAVGENTVAFRAIRSHMRAHNAGLAAVVAPGFPGRLREWAADEGVSLVTVDNLVELLRQHESVPLGLDVYRHLFKGSNVGEIAACAEEQRRWLELTARALGAMVREAGTEPHLLARDLYHFLQREQPPEDIEVVLETLAAPVLGVLDKAGDGYQICEAPATSARRLRVLADLIDASSKEAMRHE